MEEKDIIVGMKVIPIRKTIRYIFNMDCKPIQCDDCLDRSVPWQIAQRKNQSYLCVKEINKTDYFTYYVLGYDMYGGGDFFLASDFDIYPDDVLLQTEQQVDRLIKRVKQGYLTKFEATSWYINYLNELYENNDITIQFRSSLFDSFLCRI